MVSCLRCARSQTPCRLSTLSQKCGECVRKGRKCEPAEPVVNFSGIDKALEKLEREELETEAALDLANAQAQAANETARVKQAKLKRLRQQRRFIKAQEQRMFDKGLDDVEELERLEQLEKAQEIQTAAAHSSSLDDFLDADMQIDNINWLDPNFLGDGIAVGDPGNSQGS